MKAENGIGLVGSLMMAVGLAMGSCGCEGEQETMVQVAPSNAAPAIVNNFNIEAGGDIFWVWDDSTLTWRPVRNEAPEPAVVEE